MSAVNNRAAMAGFSGMEIAIVLLILGLVLWLSVPAYQGYLERAKVIQATVALGDMSKGIRQFEASKGTLPGTLADVGYGNSADPWGFPYVYLNLRTAGGGVARKDKKLKPLNSDFDLYSLGPDGLSAPALSNKASRDDIIRARDGGFIGPAVDFDP